MKNKHKGELLLVKLQAKSCNVTKINTPLWECFTFSNYINGTKSRKTSHISIFKGALSSLKQFFTTESPLKMMKNAFYFTSKALFVLKIF